MIKPELFERANMQPSDLEIEQTVLGSLLLEKDTIYSAAGILSPEVFYYEKHEQLYRVILHLFDNKIPIDIITVSSECRKRKLVLEDNTAYFISRLTNKVASNANIEFHIAILKQLYIQRELIRISTSTLRSCYDASMDVSDTLSSLEKSLTVIQGQLQNKSVKHISEIADKVVKDYDESLKLGVTGVPSGLIDLDKRTGGWQKSDLVIIAGRPGMGKTAIAIGFAKHAAQCHEIPVAIFSCEMSADQVATRIISQESNMAVERIRRRHLLDDEIVVFKKASNDVGGYPIYIDDTSSLTIRELKSKASKLKREKNIGLIVIDYLQLMTDGSAGKINRDQEIGNISRAMKALAKDLDVPIIALSQLSREVEKRGGQKRPQLSDLRESGSIEQDSDMVIFIHRPEYYDPNAVDDEGNSLHGIAEIIIAKHRNGSLENILCEFEGRTTLFKNMQTSKF